MKGLLITFEGIDGSGKSTQALLLQKRLETHGYPVRLYREPGGTAIGEKIRSILLDNGHSDMFPLTELFLYLAARAQITAQWIVPSLNDGFIVLMDRYIDSTIAYQGYARGLGIERLRELNLIATGGLLPDMTFVIDCNPLVALTRHTSLPDRLEVEGVEFMNRVREGFLLLGGEEPERVIIIDGARGVSVIEEEIFQKVNTVLKRF
ncbi:MAG: dTMP kinase [Candidatus Latescibacter sp.]|nr:dTMP kinase [Candidatus Latescibacter sp.]